MPSSPNTRSNRRNGLYAFRSDVIDEARSIARERLEASATVDDLEKEAMKIVRKSFSKGQPKKVVNMYIKGQNVPARLRAPLRKLDTCIEAPCCSSGSHNLRLDVAPLCHEDISDHTVRGDVARTHVLDFKSVSVEGDESVVVELGSEQEHVGGLQSKAIGETQICGQHSSDGWQGTCVGEAIDIADTMYVLANQCEPTRSHGTCSPIGLCSEVGAAGMSSDAQGSSHECTKDLDVKGPPAPGVPFEGHHAVRPRQAHRMAALRAYVRIHRQKLLSDARSVDPLVTGKDAKLKVWNIARKKYNRLSPEEQWELALEHCAMHAGGHARGASGQFISASTGCLHSDVLPGSKFCHLCGCMLQEAPTMSAQNGHGTPTRPYSAITARIRRRRKTRLRTTLSSVAGGKPAQPSDVAAVLEGVLTADEWQAMLASKHIPHKAAKTHGSWASIGKTMVETILHRFADMTFMVELICMAARQASLTLRSCTDVLGIRLPRRTWLRSSGSALPERKAKRANGRLGFRRLNPDVGRALLLDASLQTSSLLRGRKRKIDADGQPVMKVRRALDTSYRQLWLQDKRLQSVSLRTWHRNCQRDEAYENIRPTKRRLDCCMKCLQWDKVTRPSATRWFKLWRGKLENAWHGYWDRRDKECRPLFSRADVLNLDLGCLTALIKYVTKQKPQGLLSAELELVVEHWWTSSAWSQNFCTRCALTGRSFQRRLGFWKSLRCISCISRYEMITRSYTGKAWTHRKLGASIYIWTSNNMTSFRAVLKRVESGSMPEVCLV